MGTDLDSRSQVRMNQNPYVIRSLAMLWRWIISAIRRKPRDSKAEFRAFLRHCQRRVLLVGKMRALQELSRSHRPRSAECSDKFRQLSDARA